MNVRFLETFIWVARMRSFSGAALRINSTQAAVSNRIATLERDLGTRLFERDVGSVNLTRAGRLLLEGATDIVRLTNELRATASNPDVPKRTIAVGAIDLVAHGWLPALMQDIKLSHPDASFSLCIDTNDDIVDRLVSGEIDLALVTGPLLNADFVNLELGELECAWFSSQPSAEPLRPVTLKALFAEAIIMHTRDSRLNTSLLQLMDRNDIARCEARIFNTNSIAAIVSLTEAGLGVACIPTRIAAPAVEGGRLHRVAVEVPAPSIPLHAIFPQRNDCSLPASAARMAATIAHSFRDPPLHLEATTASRHCIAYRT